jgi:hypothetical protein
LGVERKFSALEGAHDMRDEDKTKEQLIRELVELRRQLSEATGRPPKTEEVRVEGKPGPIRTGHDVTPSGEAVEPWLSVETKLVIWSVIAGIAALIVLATLVHMFLLGGH